jgi:uncharacterized protein YciI
MSLFAVTRVAGPAWVDGKGAFEQPDVAAHGGYMDELAKAGLLLLAGPLAGTEQGRIRVLLVAEAGSAEEVARRLADDPWERSRRLTTETIEPWGLLVGAERLTTALRS